MAKKTDYIEVLRSQPSRRDMQRFLKELKDANEQINRMMSGFRDLQNVTKAVRFNAVQNTGVNSVLAGRQFQEEQKARRDASMAGPERQRIEREKEANRLTKERVGLIKQETKEAQARSMVLPREIRNAQQLSNVTELRTMKERAILRLAIAQQEQTKYQQSNARKLVSTIEQRIAALKEEAAIKRQMSDQDKRRESRQNTVKRLFGDDSGASLFVIQTGIMANYMALSQLTQGLAAAREFVIRLDESFHNLQAIVRVTDTNMARLKDSLIDISEETKFTANEIAEASVVLGQAGFSVSQIEQSAEAVSLLATATGTDLNRAVDIATATLGVFDMQAAQMSDVANTLTEAVNSSKLNIEKLTLGLQYSGNIAAQSGVRFEELTAALGAMANAGIRSGSTLGTGMRQILIALQKPSGEFMETLDRLGLSMHDVDLQSKGLYGALKNLKDAGFTAGDAIRSFEVRAAAAFNAVSGNLDQVLDLEDSFRGTTAAVKANETQMQSLANQGRRLGSVMGSIVYEGLEPFITLLRDITRVAADFGEVLREMGGVVRLVTTSTAALISTLLIWKTIKMAGNVYSLVKSIGILDGIMGKATASSKAATVSLAGLTGGARAATMATNGLRMALVGLSGPLGIALAVTGLSFALAGLSGNSRQSVRDLEDAQTMLDRASGEVETYAERIESLDGTLSELNNRYDMLNSDQKMLDSTVAQVRNQFIKMGKDASGVGGNVDNLIDSVKELRRELSEEMVAKVRIENGRIENLVEARRRVYEELIGNIERDRQREARSQSYTYQGRAPQPGVSSEMQDVAQFDPTASLMDLQRKQVSLQSRVNSLKNQDASGNREEINALERAMERLAPLVDALTALEKAERDRTESEKRLMEAIERDRVQVEDLITGSKALSDQADERLAQAQKPRDGEDTLTTREQYRRAEEVRAQINEEAEAILREAELLAEQGIITSPNILTEIRQNLSEGSGVVDRSVDELLEASNEVSATLAEGVMEDLNTMIDSLGAEMDRTDNTDYITRLRNRQEELINQWRDMQVEALEAEELDPEVLAARTRRTNDEASRRIQELRRETQDRISEIYEDRREKMAEDERDRVNEEIDLQKGELDRLQDLMKDADTKGEVTQIWNQIRDLLSDINRLEAQVQELSDDPEVAAGQIGNRLARQNSRFAGARGAYNDELARIDEKRLELIDKYNKRGSRLNEIQEERVRLEGMLAEYTGSNDVAMRARTRIALANLDREEKALRDNKEVLSDLMEEWEEAQDSLKTLPVDQRSEARDALNEIRLKIIEAMKAGADFDQLSLANLLSELDTVLDRVRNIGDEFSGIDTKRAEWGQTYRQMISPEGADEYQSRERGKALSAAAEKGILDLIMVAEGTMGNARSQGYNTTLGYGEFNGPQFGKNPVLTGMTLREIRELQKSILQNPNNDMNSSAVGGFQIVGSTLFGSEFLGDESKGEGLRRKLGVDWDERFTPELQRRMAMQLIAENGGGVGAVQNQWEGAKPLNPNLIRQGLIRTGDEGGLVMPSANVGEDEDQDGPLNKFAFNQMMDRFKTGVGSAEIGMETGQYDPREAVERISTILQAARKEKQAREALINQLSEKTTRTKEEQNRLNEAVSEQKTLASFVRREEEDLVELKRKQGLLQLDLNQSIREWSRNNLDMGRSLEGGTLGVLDDMKNSFGTLFTDISNGTKSAKNAFRDFATSVIQSLQSVIAEMIAVSIMQKIIGSIGGGVGGIADGLLAAVAGGAPKRAAAGGSVQGALPRDSQEHLLMPGEYVLRKSAVDAVGKDNLDRINAQGNSYRSRSAERVPQMGGDRGGKPETTNIYIVSPEQKPVPGPKDIVVAVADDMHRGGVTKKLVKSISRE